MTQLVARLVLAMLILPVSCAVFVIGFALMIRPGAPPSVGGVLALWTFVYAFIGAYWLLLWSRVVRWTRRRRHLTTWAAPCALLLGTSMGGACLYTLPGMPVGMAMLVGGGVVPIVWVLMTVLIWRETPAERMERISAAGGDAVCCPICGYNMTGLHESRCPECGSKFTLDQLLAGQPAREQVTLPKE